MAINTRRRERRRFEIELPDIGHYFRKVRLWIVFVWVAWVSYQCGVNLFRFHAVSGNLSSLAVEVNRADAEGFKRQLVDAIGVNGVDVAPADIEISLAGADHYLIRVPFTWDLNLGFWRFEYDDTVEFATPRWPDWVWGARPH